MKAKPLKDKKGYYIAKSYNQKDIRSAVEWLKNKISKIDIEYHAEQDVYYFIDKAFSDVMEGGGADENKTIPR